MKVSGLERQSCQKVLTPALVSSPATSFPLLLVSIESIKCQRLSGGRTWKFRDEDISAQHRGYRKKLGGVGGTVSYYFVQSSQTGTFFPVPNHT